MILISQSQMLSCLMELQTYSLLSNCWKLIIQMFQFCMGLNTLYSYFSIMSPKSQLWIRWLQLIGQYTNYLVLGYITNLILYSNQNHMNFTIGTLVYSAAIITEWMFVSLECTEICAWENHFLPHFLQLNSTLCHWTQKSPK